MKRRWFDAVTRARTPSAGLLAVSVVLMVVVPGTAEARVNPLAVLTRSVQKPNVHIVIDTSGSMRRTPGETSSGADCEESNAHCSNAGFPGGMCSQTFGGCTTTADCPAGENCVGASSRFTIAKHVLGRIVAKFKDSISFGLAGTGQYTDRYPYYKKSGMAAVSVTRFLDKSHLELRGCYDETTGPKTPCTFNSMTYTLAAAPASQYRVNIGGNVFEPVKMSWCGKSICATALGTGSYAGSYYTVPYDYTSYSSSDIVYWKNRFIGKNFKCPAAGAAVCTDDATGVGLPNGSYMAWDGRKPSAKWPLEDGIYNKCDADPPPCDNDCGARWKSTLIPFLNDPAYTSTDRMLGILNQMEPVSFGGMASSNGTPTGCAFKNDGTSAPTQPEQLSAYWYMQKAMANDLAAAGGVPPCRKNYVVYMSDGGIDDNTGKCAQSNVECNGMNPSETGCQCTAFLKAEQLRKSGVEIIAIGYGAGSSSTQQFRVRRYAEIGGTGQPYYANSEGTLYQALTDAMYRAIAGSYSTSPASSSSGKQTPTGIESGTLVLDARVDFPGWKGHLIAYDYKDGPPTSSSWDVATMAFDPTDLAAGAWKQRNVFISNGATTVKIEVDDAGNVTNKDTLYSPIGLGASATEAEKIAKWMLGDPAQKNPAVFGAVINSTAIDVGAPGNDTTAPGGTKFFNDNAGRPNLTYVGASDGMLHAFVTYGHGTYAAGKEAFAFIPPEMIPILTKLYVQGGQLPAPEDHIFGLASSAKVKSYCYQNCLDPNAAKWRTMLMMTDGYGGNDMFALDVTVPHTATGFKNTTADPPVKLLWSSFAHAQSTSYDAYLGNTISVPGFFYAKNASGDDYRLIFASGYPLAGGAATQGKMIVTADADDGTIIDSVTVNGGTCSAPYDKQTHTVLTDIATAKNYGDKQELMAAYFGDTFGNLWRYQLDIGVKGTDQPPRVVDKTGAVTLVEAMGCDDPLHFAPVVVQLDRDDNAVSPNEVFLAQVTNSGLDPDTYPYAAPSKLVFRKEIVVAGKMAADTSFGIAGRVELSTAIASQICGDLDTGTQACGGGLPAGVRPAGTPTGLLKQDHSGFQVLTLWYVPDAQGCDPGDSYLTVHEITKAGVVTQKYGFHVAGEPVNSVVIVAGKIAYSSSSGVSTLDAATAPVVVQAGGGSGGEGGGPASRFRLLSWQELIQ